MRRKEISIYVVALTTSAKTLYVMMVKACDRKGLTKKIKFFTKIVNTEINMTLFVSSHSQPNLNNKRLISFGQTT